MKWLLSVIASLALAQPALAQTVVETDFTVSLADGSSSSTTTVPLVAGACYYWHLRLDKAKQALDIDEHFTLPAAPRDWNTNNDNVDLSEDRQTAIRHLVMQPQDGWIGNGWCVAKGDPTGPHSFDIMAGDKLLHRFEFDVEKRSQ